MNSFEMELENITIRKPRRANSLDDLFTSNSTLLDTTMKSLPSTSMNDSDTITNLNETIRRLTKELQSAHQEIENLNSENFRLKMDIGEGQKIIDTYKKNISADRKNMTPTSSRKRNLIRTTSTSTHSTPIKTQDFDPVNHEIKTLHPPLPECDIMNSTTQHLAQSIDQNNSPSAPIKYPPKATQDTRHEDLIISSFNSEKVEELSRNVSSPKILVLGDQQVREFAQEIAAQRNNNKWNNIYSVSGISKPYATSTQVLSNFDQLSERLKSDDIIVLGIGSNDKNPYLFLTELCSSLHKVKNNKVFILNVLNNRFLNTNLLNKHIKLIVKNYPNCQFIDTSDVMVSANNYNYVSKRFMCFKINIEIDNINYQKLVTSQLKSRCSNKDMQQKNNNNVVDKSVQTNITYYNINKSETENFQEKVCTNKSSSKNIQHFENNTVCSDLFRE